MKHIMILFLSDMHLDKNGEVQSAQYTSPDKDIISSAQTNETAVRYVMESLGRSGETLDAVFYFATNKVKENLSVKQEDGTFREMTHEACFIEPLLSTYPDLAGKFFPVDYDERMSAGKSLTAVADMAKAVREKFGTDTVIIADMTGGFRYASMLMLSVLQILEHSGIRTERVLYTNFQNKQIENATEIYNSFTLVSGADEFANFGSVKELCNYFGETDAKTSLGALLKTMENLADAFNICQPARIEEALGKMKQKIDDFNNEEIVAKNAGRENPREALFAQMLSVIEKEYGDILGEKVSRLDIIRWCIQKNFIQQAMTLCTEWIPLELVERKICYTDNPEIKDKCGKKGAKYGKSWEAQFVTEQPDDVPAQRRNTLRNLIAKALEEYANGKSAEDAAATCPTLKGALTSFFNEFKKEEEIFRNLSRIKECPTVRVKDLETDFPLFVKISRILWKDASTFNGCLRDYILRDKMSEAVFYKQFAGLGTKRFAEIFGFDQATEEAKFASENQGEVNDTDWQRRKVQYCTMLERGIMQTKGSFDTCLRCLHDYYDIRNLRNNINHANKDASFRTEVIIEKMTAALDRLEKDYLL